MWEIEAEHDTSWALEKFCWKWNGITNLTKRFRIISLIYILVLQLWLVCQYWYLWWIHLQNSRNGVWEGARQYKEAKILKYQEAKTDFTNIWAKPSIETIQNWPKKEPSFMQAENNSTSEVKTTSSRTCSSCGNSYGNCKIKISAIEIFPIMQLIQSRFSKINHGDVPPTYRIYLWHIF